ncbi:uncharacterized protein LOC143031017 isoform X2 [Oratosquilla oratoria]|uniref:uncharacterized protein LOC143030578 isoform X2 n=1 Tax=Oratosquilla oratoria TaxID=337810 RepID=UPI003F76C393
MCNLYGTVRHVRFSSGASSSSEGGGSLPGRSPGSARSSFRRRSPCGADRSSTAGRGDASRPSCYVDFCRDEDAMCESCLISISLRNYWLHIKGFQGIPFVTATEYHKGHDTSRESCPRKGSTPYPKGSARGKKASTVVKAGRGAAECDEWVREGRGRKGIGCIAEPVEGAVGGEELNPEAFVFIGGTCRRHII